ncbi:heme-binding protein [Enterobacteriaceae bacterium 4M9]|nr:heme-binding protein [Enterobacteriaceae bacterium 4M9]
MNAQSAAVSRSVQTVSLAGARKAIAAAHTMATGRGWLISVAVVDASGQLVAFEKQDGASGVTVKVACEKARTAALIGAPSKAFEDFINGGCPSFLATPDVTPLEGGVPIVLNGEIIGAVGVSGAHGANDSLVAHTAADALGA